jgi:hypothetical protein
MTSCGDNWRLKTTARQLSRQLRTNRKEKAGMTDNNGVLASILRTDLLAFARKAFWAIEPGRDFVMAPYIQLLVDLLLAVFDGTEKRLNVNLPPRHLKSFLISVAFPAWVLGRDPTRQFICLSHNENLARDHSLKCRRIIESDWYRKIFPGVQLRSDANRVDEFQTTKGGGRYAGSFNASVIGRGADFIILDDAQTPAEVMSPTEREKALFTFDGAINSRLNDRRSGAFINVTQRLHVEDLTAFFERKEFRTVALPLIATEYQEFALSTGPWKREPGDILNPTMFPLDEIEQLKRNSPLYFFEAQYQQRPLRQIGAIVDAAWFPRFSGELEFGDIVLSWDTADKADGGGSYSVCIVFHVRDGIFSVLHVFRGRLDFLDLLGVAVELEDRYRPRSVLVEEASSGRALIPALNDRRLREKKSDCVAMRTGGLSKLERLLGQIVKLKSGAVRLPERAPWLADFLAEVCAFPNVRHTDQVDALSQFLSWVNDGLPPRHELVTNPGASCRLRQIPRPRHPDRDPRNRSGIRYSR